MTEPATRESWVETAVAPDQLEQSTPLSSPQIGTRYFILKALLDYLIVVPSLLFLSPLLMTLALLVKWDSPGPIIYRRQVLGRDGRVFGAFKFRTMYVHGDEILAQRPDLVEELARNHKLKVDPRVTRIGHFLRRFSLDELPQLFNVLRREMTLIGPRIISPVELEKYGRWGETLLTVLPGLTGLWQVSGRSDTTYAQRVQLDMEYVHEWSLWLDLKILWRTIPAVMRGDGAY